MQHLTDYKRNDVFKKFIIHFQGQLERKDSKRVTRERNTIKGRDSESHTVAVMVRFAYDPTARRQARHHAWRIVPLLPHTKLFLIFS